MSNTAVAVENAAYPEKMFYRINEVSSITGVKPYVLRYWETEFPTLKPSKDAGDQRRYRRQDIDHIFQIKTLLYEEKFTIAGARRWLKNQSRARSAQVVEIKSPNAAPSVDPQMIKRTRKKISRIRREINDLYKFI